VLFGGAALLLVAGFAGCSRPPDPWKDAKAGQKHILVTFPPLYSLAHAVAGDDAYVLCFLTTQGPHDYQFNPVDGIKAKGADLLISNGLGLDDTFVGRLNDRAKVPVLNLGKELPEDLLLDMADEDEHKAEPNKGDKKDKHAGHHHHGDHDPHVWLGPPQAMVIADAIGKKLAEIDPSHRDGYLKRAAQLKDELKKLHEEGKAQFAAKKNRKIVTMHESIGYFARAFDLDVEGAIQPQPGQAPDAAQLAKLEKICRDKDVGVITYEPQYSKAQPELLQKQLEGKGLKVRLAEFDPLETAPPAADGVNPPPSYYLEKMRANIDHLAKAMP
jgi:ABC-type Zn uptake system ZnuABC Zn-binding protein ZnuA